MTSKDRIEVLQRSIGASADGVIGHETLAAFAATFKRTRIQTIHWFANFHHESNGARLGREDMDNYTPARIMEIFGVGKHSAKVTLAEAKKLAGNGYALAERVYGLGNPKKAAELGNTRVGDGWLFRGGGGMQCTGGGDYKRYGGSELYNNPDLIDTGKYYFTTAIAEWDYKKIWAKCTDLSYSTVKTVRRIVNGGDNGLADVWAKISYYDGLFTSPTTVVPSKTSVALTNLNLRKGAGTQYDVIQVLPRYTKVDIIRTVNGWSEVLTNGKTGWVSNQYLG